MFSITWSITLRSIPIKYIVSLHFNYLTNSFAYRIISSFIVFFSRRSRSFHTEMEPVPVQISDQPVGSVLRDRHEHDRDRDHDMHFNHNYLLHNITFHE